MLFSISAIFNRRLLKSICGDNGGRKSSFTRTDICIRLNLKGQSSSNKEEDALLNSFNIDL